MSESQIFTNLQIKFSFPKYFTNGFTDNFETRTFLIKFDVHFSIL